LPFVCKWKLYTIFSFSSKKSISSSDFYLVILGRRKMLDIDSPDLAAIG
jgi:hypothetical protein